MTRASRLALALMVGTLLAAILVPMLATRDPLAIDDVLARRLLPPMARDAEGHWFLLGTDRFGRDLLVRTFLAARVSLLVGLAGSLLAGVLGIAIGAVAGAAGGVIDRLLMSLADTMQAVPRLILLLLCVALWAPGLATVVVVLALTGWMGVARLVRTEVQGLRRAAFVEGATALGVAPRAILSRHILPNALGPAMVAVTLGVGNAILLESGLAFLGLGVQPPTPSWGNMIAGGRDVLVTAPWVALAPGLALILSVLGCTVLGDALQRHLSGRSELVSLR